MGFETIFTLSKNYKSVFDSKKSLKNKMGLYIL